MDTLPIPTRIAHPVPHVLLAADVGSSSTRAADEAIDLAARQGAVLLVLSVVPPAGLPRWWHGRDPDARRRRRDDAAKEVVTRASARDVIATSVVWYGEPAEAILEAARTEHADVVVLGSRNRMNLGRLFGSVSAHVAREATCPVVVVPS